MGWFIRGHVPPEEKIRLTASSSGSIHPLIDHVIRWRWTVITCAGLLVRLGLSALDWLVTRRLPEGPGQDSRGERRPDFPVFRNLGSEFMPPLYEGDLLYMPTTFPGISPTKARELIQTTDKIIKSFPEVRSAFGKIGRAETATDPAPFDMVETTIMLNDEKDWPVVDIKDPDGRVTAHRRRTPDDLVDALKCRHPDSRPQQRLGPCPSRRAFDMLATGIKTPVGIKVAGPSLPELERVASESRRSSSGCPAPPAPSPNAS